MGRPLPQEAIDKSTGEAFDVKAAWGQDEFRHRVAAYDAVFSKSVMAEALLAWWGDAPLRATLALGPKRICNSFAADGGNQGWLALRWYPVALLVYAGGIATIASERYDNLFTLLNARLLTPDGRTRQRALSLALTDDIREVSSYFKLLEGLNQRYTPLSDHLCAALKTPLDELFRLGADYERCFNEFEVFLALEYMHLTGDSWAPIGRFGWKAAYRESSPLHIVIDDAARSGASWPPLAAGLFGQSSERVAALGEQLKGIVERRGMW